MTDANVQEAVDTLNGGIAAHGCLPVVHKALGTLLAAYRAATEESASLRRMFETECEMRVALQVSQNNLLEIVRGGDANLPVSGVCIEVRDLMRAATERADRLEEDAEQQLENFAVAV